MFAYVYLGSLYICRLQTNYVQLIEKLYSSGNAQEINQLQHTLHDYQKADDAFYLAFQLVEHPLMNCKFFGALTYTVKINEVRDKLKPEEVTILIEQLEKSTSDLFNVGLNNTIMVIRKMLSNMGLLFIRYFDLYVNPVVQFFEKLHGSSDIKTFREDELKLYVLFCCILAEDVSRQERTFSIHSVFRGRIYPLVDEVFQLLSSVDVISEELNIVALDCVNAWVVYIAIAEGDSPERYPKTNSISTYLFRVLERVNGDTIPFVDKAMKTFLDILETNSVILDVPGLAYLNKLIFEPGNIGEQYMTLLAEDGSSYDSMDEINAYASLLIASVSKGMLKITKNATSTEVQYKLSLLLRLTDFPGIPVEEECVSEQFLTFWEDFISTYVDDSTTYDAFFESDPVGKEKFEECRNNIVNRVCLIFWAKCRVPEDLGGSINKEFLQYRANVADVFVAAFSLLQEPFYERVTSSVVREIHQLCAGTGSILDVERSLYILCKITDDITFFDTHLNMLIPHINSIFVSGLIDILSQAYAAGLMKHQICSTFIDFLSVSHFYLKNHTGKSYLGKVLDFLFSVLLNGSIVLSIKTSRTILKICQECSYDLIPFLPTFEALLLEVIKNYSIESIIRQRLFNAFISIAQGLRNPSKIGDILARVLSALHSRSLEIMQTHATLGEEEEDYLISLLSSVGMIGKSFENSDDIDDVGEDLREEIVKYWGQDPLHIKETVLQIVQDFSVNYKYLSNNTLCIEKCCAILKSGIREPLDGPFKFSVNVLFDYVILKMDAENLNALSSIYGLIESAVIVNYVSLNPSEFNQILEHAFSKHIKLIKTDPFAICNSVELFAVIIEKRPGLVILLPAFEDVLMFAVDGLHAKETFIIKSILNFWAAFLKLKKGNKEEHEYVRNLLTGTRLGSLLVTNLLRAFVLASRSHLEYYYTVFRNVVAKFTLEAKNWLTDAFHQLGHHILDERRIDTFVNQIMITRGQRQINEVLKKIWLQVNGLLDFK